MLEDDGMIALDFDGLNVALAMRAGEAEAGHSRGSAAVGAFSGSAADALGVDASGNLDFSAIDEDLAKFSRDDAIKGALSRGVDLLKYTRSIDSELRESEVVSIADYVKEADGIAELFEQISECEEVLTAMSGMLGDFQASLGGISSEIRHLQSQSLELATQMGNRKMLAGKITSFLQRVAVPPALVDRILDAPVDEAWLTRDLHALGDKLEFTTGRLHERAAATEAGAPHVDELADIALDFRKTPVGAEALPNLERLRVKASSRLREVLVKAFGELARMRTNIGKQQEHVLLKLAPGVAFLNAYSPEVAREVRSVYADMVGRLYADVFKKYVTDLRALTLPLPPKSENIIDYHPNTRAGIASAALSPAVMAGRAAPMDGVISPFSNADRLAILSDADAPPLPSAAAAADKSRLSFESMWRSVQRHLMDMAAAESSFDTRFFGEGGADVFALTMSLSINTLLATLEEHLAMTGDAAGLMVIVALMGLHRQFMHQRYKCDALDQYFDRVVMLIWPNFKKILDANLSAVKSAKESVRARVGSIDVSANAATRRFAEFYCSICVINRSLPDQHRDGMLPTHMAVLTKEVNSLLEKCAMELSSKPARVAFMINNYAACLQIAGERSVSVEDAAVFQTSRAHYTRLYVDAEVESQFRTLLGFVKKTEAAAAATAGVTAASTADGRPPGPPTIGDIPVSVLLRVDVPEAVAVMRDFNVTWRNGLRVFSENLGRYFPDNRVASEVLRAVLESFSFLYQRFTVILGRALPATSPELRELVEGRLLQLEIMKYIKAAAGTGADAF